MDQSKPEDLGAIAEIDLLLSCLNIQKEDIGIGEKFINPRIISTGLPDIQLPIKKTRNC